jgi:hypothetical protein
LFLKIAEMKAHAFLKIITILNLLVATGFSVTGMINPDLILPAGANAGKSMEIFALYAGARTIPLAVIGIVSVISKRRDTLIVIAFLTGTIQVLDGFIGIYQNDLSKIAGPFVIAFVEFLAIYFATVKVKTN